MDRGFQWQSGQSRPNFRKLAQRGRSRNYRGEEITPFRDTVEANNSSSYLRVRGSKKGSEASDSSVARMPVALHDGILAVASGRRVPQRRWLLLLQIHQEGAAAPGKSMFPERRNARSAIPDAIHSVTIPQPGRQTRGSAGELGIPSDRAARGHPPAR